MQVPVAHLLRLETLDRGDEPAANDLERALLEVLELREAPEEAWQLGLAAVFLEWSRDRWRDRRIELASSAGEGTFRTGRRTTAAAGVRADIEDAERQEARADDRLRALHWAFGHSLGHLDITLGAAARHIVGPSTGDRGAREEGWPVEQWRRTPLTVLDV